MRNSAPLNMASINKKSSVHTTPKRKQNALTSNMKAAQSGAKILSELRPIGFFISNYFFYST